MRFIPLLLALVLAPTFCSRLTAEEAAPFHPPGMWTWDNWFVHDGARWHAFYLQLPHALGEDRRWKDNDFYKHVGHATSTDLRTWQDEGPALCALSGIWNDRHIATGSIARHGDRWWMVYTARGTRGDGVGLVSSTDLSRWEPAHDGPLFALTGTWGGEVEGGVFTSDWLGSPRRWVGISDPYLVPETEADGSFTMILCSRILDVPIAESGCLTILKSRDLIHWNQPAILAWPGCFERMETPQRWDRGDRIYLSFGGVLNKDLVAQRSSTFPAAVRGRPSHANFVYLLGEGTGVAGDDDLHFVEVPKGHYIMKILESGDGSGDVALFTQTAGKNSGISPPYQVRYDERSAIRITAIGK